MRSDGAPRTVLGPIVRGKKNWQAVLASRPEEHRKVDRQTRTLYALTDEVIGSI